MRCGLETWGNCPASRACVDGGIGCERRRAGELVVDLVLPYRAVTGLPRFHLLLRGGDVGGDVGGVVLCIVLTNGAAQHDKDRWKVLLLINM
jgi:hypothetical protein